MPESREFGFNKSHKLCYIHEEFNKIENCWFNCEKKLLHHNVSVCYFRLEYQGKYKAWIDVSKFQRLDLEFPKRCAKEI